MVSGHKLSSAIGSVGRRISMREFLAQKPQTPLFHYTNPAGFLGIFKSKELWVTDDLHLNDAAEISYALERLQSQIKLRLNSGSLSEYWRTLYEEWGGQTYNPSWTATYVVSFSEIGNQLSQWRAYCPGGNGFSIGFSPSNLQYLQKLSGFQLVRCVYTDADQQDLLDSIIRYMDHGWRRIQQSEHRLSLLARLGGRLNAAMLAIKNSGFSEEREWRLVGHATQELPARFPTGRFGLLPYCGVPLCGHEEKPGFQQVYVGPTSHPELVKDTAVHFLRQHADFYIDRRERVVNSEIPYRY